MCSQPNVQVMGFGASTFLLQHRIQRYRQVNTKNLQKERKECIVPPASWSGRCHVPDVAFLAASAPASSTINVVIR
jgi:hypothetical protein